MMKNIIQILIVSLPFALFGQETKTPQTVKKNTIYVEALGQGIFNSIAFDRIHLNKKNFKTSFSAGVTLVPYNRPFVFGLPLSYNILFGKGNHHLELGFGITALYTRSSGKGVENYIDGNGNMQIREYKSHVNSFYSYFTPKIGYRYQKPDGGFFFRLTFTPIIGGINKYGKVQSSGIENKGYYTENFKTPAFMGNSRIQAWAGMSLGWTFKK